MAGSTHTLNHAASILARGASLPAELEATDAPAVRRCLEQGADPNRPMPTYNSKATLPLCWVMAHAGIRQSLAGYNDTLSALFEHGATVAPQGPPVPVVADHPLASSLTANFAAVFDRFFAHAQATDPAAVHAPVRVRIFGKPEHSTTLLDLALAEGNGHAAQRLWDEAGIKPHPTRVCPTTGLPQPSTLVHALTWGMASPIRPLLDRLLEFPWSQADLDAALRQAAAKCDASTINRLVRLGANARHQPPDQAPLAVLPFQDRKLDPPHGMVAALAAHGADVAAPIDIRVDKANSRSRAHPPSASPGEDGVAHATQPLGLAAYRGQDRVVEELLAAGANPRHASAEGLTPLHLACMASPARPWMRTERLAVIEQLLDAGADPAALDANGRTPLEAWLCSRAPSPDYPASTALAAACPTGQRLAMATLAARPQHLDALAAAWLALPSQACGFARGIARALEIHARHQGLEAALPPGSRPPPSAPRL